MKKGTLHRHGKGWKIVMDSGKSISIPSGFSLTQDLDGKEVLFDNTGGPVKKIICDNKEYERSRQRDFSRGRGSTNGRGKRRYPAFAPYNFVPLREKTIELPSSKRAMDERFYGHIELAIVAKTPLFIRGVDGQFFRTIKEYYLPGSSLRGMVRHLVELISCSSFLFFDDKQLYRRSTKLVDDKRSIIKAGFLYLCHANNGSAIFRIREGRFKNLGECNSEFYYKRITNGWKFSTGRFGSRNPVLWQVLESDEARIYNVNDDLVESYRLDISRSDSVPDLLVALHRERINGESFSKYEVGVPVFFRVVGEGNGAEVISFGHCKYHRIPYRYSIGSAIPEDLKKEVLDFASSLFGTVKRATKVFFEDGILLSEPKLDLSKPAIPKILASPKPTCYQHYLEQESVHVKESQLIKWDDSSARIRGYKEYWHRHTSSKREDKYTWMETEKEKTKSHSSPINPLSVGAAFSARIRFENLSQEELGALLFALDLPEGCAHKLGMGKPLGLGSVRITPKLTLIDRSKRYAQIFDENGNWMTAEREEADLEAFKNAFAKYMGEQIAGSRFQTADDYWEKDPRMQQLKCMLTFLPLGDAPENIRMWQEATRYMKIQPKNEYKNRPVLPKACDMVRESVRGRSKKL